MKSKLRSFACLAASVAGILAIPAFAAIPLGENSRVQIGGFFSQGYLYASDNNYPTVDKGGTWDFREMAFNASTTFGSHLRVGAQGFAQKLGSLGGDRVILDWAVADYNFNPAFGIRAGRVKYPKGLYGEALDLDVVRPFVFLPNAVYNPIMRDFSASFDGAMIYGSFNLGRSSIDYKAFYGDIPMNPRMGVAEFYNNAGIYTASGVSAMAMDSVMGGQLSWSTPVSGLKFLYSYSSYRNLNTDGPFVAVPALNAHSNIARFSWNTVSAEYVRGDWSFAAEFQRSGGDFGYSVPPIVPLDVSSVGWDGWYVSGARRFLTKWEVGAYYGYLKNRYPSATAADFTKHQADYCVAVRYDISEHVLVKVEGHYIDGTYQTFNTSRIPNPKATLSEDNTVFAVKTTFSF
jgi:hypothetical protein